MSNENSIEQDFYDKALHEFYIKKNFCHDDIDALLASERQTRQYSKYLHGVLHNLPMVSLWDVCLLFARVLVCEDLIPNGLEGVLLNKAHKREEQIPYNLREKTEVESTLKKDWEYTMLNMQPDFLLPIQKWLSDQITVSIEKKNIIPTVLGRFTNGKLDAKSTYVENKQIDEWLYCRGIGEDLGVSNTIYFYFKYSHTVSIESIRDSIFAASNHIMATAYNPEYATVSVVGDNPLKIENSRLKRQLAKRPYKSDVEKVHGNTIRHAKNREQVLGAALSVITMFTEQCQNASNKFEATKIAKLIDERSLLFWPEEIEPPLSRQQMEREIGKWLKITVK